MASSGSYTGDVASVDGKVLPLLRNGDAFLVENSANGDVYHMEFCSGPGVGAMGFMYKNVYPGNGRCAYPGRTAYIATEDRYVTDPPPVPAPVCACCNGTKVTKSLFLGVDMPCPECKEQ